jgi:electron transfer flavoprotein beta subunit
MKIVVCIKQVPDTAEVKLDPKTGTLIRDGVPSIINHDDKAGLEAALQLREKLNDGSTVTVVCMGPPQADVALREALAMGADEAHLVSAREFGGSDTYATATIIATALKKIGYDMVITGRQAIDGDTAQVGPQIAEQLKIPQVSYAQELDIVNGEVIVNRQYEDQFHILKVQLPCLVTALAELSEPRYMHAGGIVDAYNKEVKVWAFDDLKNDLNPEWIGLKGSPTNVFQSFGKKPKTPGTIYDGLSVEEAVEKIMAMLIERHII